MNIQQIIDILEGAQKRVGHGVSRSVNHERHLADCFMNIGYRLDTAIENLRTLQQLEGMTATQEPSNWVLMPKHLTDDMVRAAVSKVLGGCELSEGLDYVLGERLGPELETLYQSLIEARPQ